MKILKLVFVSVFFLVTTELNAADSDKLSEPDQMVEAISQIVLDNRADKDREVKLKKVLEQAELYKSANSKSAKAWLALARVKFRYADTQSQLTGLKLMKDARKDIEQALVLDAQVENGFGKSYLGYLYFTMPPWPLGFRDKDKGVELIKQSLEIDGKSVANNYFYGSVLYYLDKYDEASSYLARARDELDSLNDFESSKKIYARGIDSILAAIEAKR